MERVHPIHVVTLAVVVLGAIFAFVAMRVAFDAREAAWSASSSVDTDSTYFAVWELQTALIEAGVIDDPTLVPDDHGELGGPWARCLTADERDELGLGEDVALPAPCDAVTVSLQDECPELEPQDVGEVDDVCLLLYEVDGRRYENWGTVDPEDVETASNEWFHTSGVDDVDRAARGPDSAFVHVVGEGWMQLHPYG